MFIKCVKVEYLMSPTKLKRLNTNFVKEYEFFIEEYLFSLLGIVNKKLVTEMYQTSKKKRYCRKTK